MKNGTRSVVALAIAALCACSGGGGGGGGGDGPVGGGGFWATPTAFTFVYVRGGVAPATQAGSAGWTASDVYAFAAGYVHGGTKPPWLTVSLSATPGTHYGSFWVGVDWNATPPGSYTHTFQLGIGRADGSVIGYRDVTVTFIVKDVGVNTEAVSSTAVFGSSVLPASQVVYPLAPTTTSWTASVDQSWLHLSAVSGQTGSPVTVTFDPTGLATGSHVGHATFNIGGAISILTATFTIANPVLTALPATVALAGLGGHDLLPKRVEVTLDTGSNAYPFTVTSGDDWLELATSATSVSATPARFTVRPTAAASTWAPGTYQGAVTVAADVNGVQIRKRLAISYVLDALALRVEADGVALARVGSLSRLTRSLRVATNRGTPVTWTAVSDQPWLDATPLGTTGPLVLSADPTGLATDAVHEATVTVYSGDAGLVSATETVRVGLWLGSATPDPVTAVSTGFVAVAADPVRPYAYLTDGSGQISVVNVHTGERAGTIAIAGAALRAITVSSDGTRLFAVDAPARAVVPVALPAGTPGALWPLSPLEDGWGGIAFARTNGTGVVVTTAGSVHSAATGAPMYVSGRFGSFREDTVATSRDGSRFCTIDHGLSPYSVSCRGLDATSLSGGPILVGPEERTWPASGSWGEDVALSADGTSAFVAAGGPYAFSVYDPTSLAENMPVVGQLAPGSAYATAIEVGPDGRFYCGTATEPDTLATYDAAGTFLGSAQIGQVTRALLVLSGDGLRAVAGTGTPYAADALKLVTVPPP